MNPIQIFTGSFYDPTTYKTAQMPQSGMHLFYSFLLVSLSVAVLCVSGILFLDRTFMQAPAGKTPVYDAFVLGQAALIPPFTIHDNVLSTKVAQPYAVPLVLPAMKDGKNKNEDTSWIVFDTTGATTVADMKAPVLVTAKELYIKSSNKTEVYTYEQFTKNAHNPMIVNRAVLNDSAERLVAWTHKHRLTIYVLFAIPAWIGGVFVMYILRLFMLMALSVVAIIVGRIYNHPVDFATGIRISAVAYTPVVVLSTLSLALTAHSPGSLTLLLLGALMLVAGFQSTREKA